MLTMDDKKRLILEHEKWFANIVSGKVLPNPVLSLWMILIPVFFVYFFFQFQKVTGGRKDFAENYIKSKVRALDAAEEAVTSGKAPDYVELANLTDVTDKVRKLYEEVMQVLVEHYIELLQAKGDDYEDLVRTTYRNQTNFMLFHNRLNRAEQRIDAALRPKLQKDVEGADSVIKTMEAQAETLRRHLSERIFT